MNCTDFEYDEREPDDDYLEAERERIYFDARAEVESQCPSAPEFVLHEAAERLAESEDVEGEPDVDEDGNATNGSLHMVYRISPKQAIAETWRRFRVFFRGHAFGRPFARRTPVRRPREHRARRTRTASRGSPAGDPSSEPPPPSLAVLPVGRAA